MRPSINGTKGGDRGGFAKYNLAKNKVAQAIRTIRSAAINRQLSSNGGQRSRPSFRGGKVQPRSYIPAGGLISASKRELLSRIINSRQQQELGGRRTFNNFRGARFSNRGQRSFRRPSRFSTQNGGSRSFTPRFSVPFKRVQNSSGNNENSVDQEYLMQARALIKAQSERKPFAKFSSNRGSRFNNSYNGGTGFRRGGYGGGRGRFQQRRFQYPSNNSRFLSFDNFGGGGYKPRGGRGRFNYNNRGYFNRRSNWNAVRW